MAVQVLHKSQRKFLGWSLSKSNLKKKRKKKKTFALLNYSNLTKLICISESIVHFIICNDKVVYFPWAFLKTLSPNDTRENAWSGGVKKIDGEAWSIKKPYNCLLQPFVKTTPFPFPHFFYIALLKNANFLNQTV